MSSNVTNTIRLHRRAARLALLGASSLALAACAVGIADAPRVSSAPNVIYAELRLDNLTGVYSPAAYSSADVQKGLAQICGNQRITDYSERPAGDMIAFFGHCWGGTDITMGTVVFTRVGDRLYIDVPGYIEREQYDRNWSIQL